MPGQRALFCPAYCAGDSQEVQAAKGVPVDRGLKDLRDLPNWFSSPQVHQQDYGRYSIEIIAEINHAPRLSREELLQAALAGR